MKTEYKPYVDALIELAIREDIGDGATPPSSSTSGSPTARACVRAT